jgi:predicted dithiol-disulfide oxidoreductase (DUF899 family)
MQTMEAGNRVLTHEEWLAERRTLLARERELTRLRDQVTRERQQLPWELVEKPYTFTGPDGQETLSSLFAGRSQLMIYHFMFAPGWKEGCPGCSFMADHFDGALPHIEQHDVSFAAVSRAPLAEFQAFRKRMGWKFKWISSNGTDFNRDFGVTYLPEQVEKGEKPYNYGTSPLFGEEMPGLSVFAKDDAGTVYHTWSGYARGLENMLGTYSFVDLLPKGRRESGPTKSMMDWLRYHDQYGTQAGGSCCHH